jgi:hypothetical protein
MREGSTKEAALAQLRTDEEHLLQQRRGTHGGNMASTMASAATARPYFVTSTFPARGGSAVPPLTSTEELGNLVDTFMDVNKQRPPRHISGLDVVPLPTTLRPPPFCPPLRQVDLRRRRAQNEWYARGVQQGYDRGMSAWEGEVGSWHERHVDLDQLRPSPADGAGMPDLRSLSPWEPAAAHTSRPLPGERGTWH